MHLRMFVCWGLWIWRHQTMMLYHDRSSCANLDNTSVGLSGIPINNMTCYHFGSWWCNSLDDNDDKTHVNIPEECHSMFGHSDTDATHLRFQHHIRCHMHMWPCLDTRIQCRSPHCLFLDPDPDTGHLVKKEKRDRWGCYIVYKCIHTEKLCPNFCHSLIKKHFKDFNIYYDFLIVLVADLKLLSRF